jgi:hypothetical protein
MMMRRRPLLGAAVIGGAAYHMGKKGAQASQQEADQNAQIADLQAQQQAQQTPPPAPVAAAPAAAAGGTSIADQLTQLKGLMDAGVLSPEEFEAAKQKALAGG